MRLVVLALAASLVLGCGSCGGAGHPADAGGADAAGEAGTGADAATGDAGLLPFGAECTADEQCASNVCFLFGQGQWCTLKCTDASQCPAGSQGQKCNQQGYCRP